MGENDYYDSFMMSTQREVYKARWQNTQMTQHMV